MFCKYTTVVLVWATVIIATLGIPYYFALSEAKVVFINVTSGSLMMLWALDYLDRYRISKGRREH